MAWAGGAVKASGAAAGVRQAGSQSRASSLQAGTATVRAKGLGGGLAGGVGRHVAVGALAPRPPAAEGRRRESNFQRQPTMARQRAV